MKNKHGLILCALAFIFGVFYMPTIVAIAAVGGLMFAVLSHDDATQEKKIKAMLLELRTKVINGTPLESLTIEQREELDALEMLSHEEIEARFEVLQHQSC